MTVTPSATTRASSRTRWTLTLAAALVAATLATPPVARGQQLRAVGVGPAATTMSRADDLDARAIAVEDCYWDSRELRGSAELREAAARLRTAADPRAAVSLRWAAYDRYAAGDSAAAGRLMEAAAARAATTGELRAAVRSYVDAAIIAEQLGREPRVRELLATARRVAETPTLNAEQQRVLQTIVTQHFTN
jgi:hypothetical protein